MTSLTLQIQEGWRFREDWISLDSLLGLLVYLKKVPYLGFRLFSPLDHEPNDLCSNHQFLTYYLAKKSNNSGLSKKKRLILTYKTKQSSFFAESFYLINWLSYRGKDI